MKPGTQSIWSRRLWTAGLGLVGAATFLWLGLPLPFLLGPLAICLAASLSGARLSGPGEFGTLMRTILGVAAGSSITPQLFSQLGQTAQSVAFVPLFLLAVGLIGYPYFRRVAGFDPVTAFFAAMPGGVQDMVLFGQLQGGDTRALSLVHATRIMLIVSLMPIFMQWYVGSDLRVAPGLSAADTPARDMAIMAVCAVAGYYLARRLGIFGAPILGPMILTAVASLLGLIHTRPPSEALVVAQYFIGISIGAYYVGVTWRELYTVVLSAIGFAFILGGLTLLFAEIVYAIGAGDMHSAILAFAPGGQGEMVILALLTGGDISFIILHHVVRLIIVLLGTPIIGTYLK